MLRNQRIKLSEEQLTASVREQAVQGLVRGLGRYGGPKVIGRTDGDWPDLPISRSSEPAGGTRSCC